MGTPICIWWGKLAGRGVGGVGAGGGGEGGAGKKGRGCCSALCASPFLCGLTVTAFRARRAGACRGGKKQIKFANSNFVMADIVDIINRKFNKDPGSIVSPQVYPLSSLPKPSNVADTINQRYNRNHSGENIPQFQYPSRENAHSVQASDVQLNYSVLPQNNQAYDLPTKIENSVLDLSLMPRSAVAHNNDLPQRYRLQNRLQSSTTIIQPTVQAPAVYLQGTETSKIASVNTGPPDLNWIDQDTKYKTLYLSIPTIKQVPRFVKRLKNVEVEQEVSRTRMVAVQVRSGLVLELLGIESPALQQTSYANRCRTCLARVGCTSAAGS